MKITRINAFRVALPLARPYRLSGGKLLFGKLDSTIVRVDTDEDISGWGESCPWGNTYLPAYAGGVRSGLDYLAPLIIGRDPVRIDDLNRCMDQCLPGHPYVKSAIDMACWDILGKCFNRPLYDLFGGSAQGPLPVNSSIPTGDPAAMIDSIQAHRQQGYRVHSCKIGGDDVEHDVLRIKTIEAQREEKEIYTYDANRSWLPATAIQVMNAVETPFSWFEQPCETIEECAQVRASTRQSLVLDECLHTFRDLQQAVDKRVCEGIKLKPNRVGGLTKAKLMRDYCLQNGIRMHIEDVGGSVLADTAAVHLAVSTPTTHRLASWLCHEMTTIDVAPGQGARNDSGKIEVPARPGIGVEPDQITLGQAIAEYA